MKKLNRVLYDKLGREYPRLNLYLRDVSELEYQISQEGGERKSELKSKLSDLKKNKDSHPYIVELKKFKEEEKKFLSELKDKVKKFAETINIPDKKTKEYEVKTYENTQINEFYSKYQNLDYDAKLAYEVSEIKKYYYPQIVKTRLEIDKEISNEKANEKNLTPSVIEAGRKKHEEEKALLKKQFEEESNKLKEKRKQELISKLALFNERRQLKQRIDSEIRISKLNIPDIKHKEFIKTKEYELKERTKVLEEIINKDIADVRSKTPVETENVNPYLSFLTLLFPGVGQIINKQYIKGILFLIGTLFIYLIAVPYALGYGNYQGWGVAGLITLAEGGTRLQKSLIFMIEGLVAIALLAISFAIIIVSFKDNRKVEKDRAIGIREKNWFQTSSTIEQEGFPILVSLPALLITIFLVLIPIAVTILLSFTNMDPDHQSKFQWAGLSNYITVFTGTGIAGKAFWNILLWTLVWTFVATSSALFVGFALALLANNKRIKGKALFRIIYLLPWAVPAFITIMFFSIMSSPNGFISDLVNAISGFFGGRTNINIKQETNVTRTALIFMQTWLGSAYVFLLSTGVLQAIPEDLYEAAQIDGASSWQKTMKITLPLVLFQTMPLLIGQYTFNFNNFGAIFLFNEGGPFDTSKYGNLAGSTDLLISYIYKLSLTQNYQALAAAITMIISLALMLFAYIGFKNSKAFKEERL